MKLFPLVLSIAVMAGCTAVPPRPTSFTRADYASTQAYVTRLIQYEMDKNAVPGLSIALVDDQHVGWAQGFGYADVARNQLFLRQPRRVPARQRGSKHAWQAVRRPDAAIGLAPLGMASSSFDTGPSASARMAKGYRGHEATPETPLRDVPAGGASGDQRILKPETVAKCYLPLD